jgi:hypothetical protein
VITLAGRKTRNRFQLLSCSTAASTGVSGITRAAMLGQSSPLCG